jgi:hypothetical protein
LEQRSISSSDSSSSSSSPWSVAVSSVVNLLQNFSFSEGWLNNFCVRHGLSSTHYHGEGGSAPEELVNRGRVDLQQLLQSYSLCDIYNADEFALFYEVEPSTTVDFKSSSRDSRGTKLSKKRLTGLVCTNADGSDKFKARVIGRSKTPRPLKGLNRDCLPCVYRNSSKAWMTNVLFSELLESFDKHIRTSDVNRKVILLIDGAACHGRPGQYGYLKNVQVHFLPPNCTSHLQPLDAGIIRSLKAHYRVLLIKRHIRWYDKFSIRQPDGKYQLSKPYEPPSIKDAIELLANAWGRVTSITISNCWVKTQILPVQLQASLNVDDEYRSRSIASEFDELATKIMNLQLKTNEIISTELRDCAKLAEELVDCDSKELIESDNSPDVIILDMYSEIAGHVEENDSWDDEVEALSVVDEQQHPIGHGDAVDAIDNLIEVLLKCPKAGDPIELTSFLDQLRKQKQLHEDALDANFHQSEITDYFAVMTD